MALKPGRGKEEDVMARLTLFIYHNKSEVITSLIASYYLFFSVTGRTANAPAMLDLVMSMI